MNCTVIIWRSWVRGASVLSRTWTKNINYGNIIQLCSGITCSGVSNEQRLFWWNGTLFLLSVQDLDGNLDLLWWSILQNILTLTCMYVTRETIFLQTHKLQYWRKLNFASDIDLLFFYHSNTYSTSAKLFCLACILFLVLGSTASSDISY